MPIRKNVAAPAAAVAPAPSRATGKFTVTLGLLSVPLDVFTSTEDITVKREQFLVTGEKVGMCPAVKNDDGTYGDKVERSDIVKKFPTEAGLVDLADDEIDRLSTVVSGTADVIAVHPLTLLGTHYLANGKVWQARAGKLGSGRAAKANPGGESAYGLLLTALEAKKSFMLIRWSRAGSVYLSALMPSGRLVGLFHDNEVRAERDLPKATYTREQVALAGTLLDAFTEKAPVAVVNDIPAKVAAYAATKAVTGEVMAPAQAPAAAPAGVDIMSLLTASVEAAKAGRVAVSA